MRKLRAEWGATGHLNLKFFAFFQFQAALNILLSIPMLVGHGQCIHSVERAGICRCLYLADRMDRQKALLINTAEIILNAMRTIKAGCATSVCGDTHVIPTIFLNGLSGLVTPRLHLHRLTVGWRCSPLPFLMLHFLLNVTGVKATEEQALRSKGEAYAKYQRTVSAFIPLPRKQELK